MKPESVGMRIVGNWVRRFFLFLFFLQFLSIPDVETYLGCVPLFRNSQKYSVVNTDVFAPEIF